MQRILLILVLLIAMAPAAVHAEVTGVLAGMQSVSFSADLGEYYDIPPVPGINLLVAFDMGLRWDLRLGVKTGTEGNSDDDLTYQWIEVGPRFIIGKEDAFVRPDWFAGIGSYNLEIGSTKFDAAIGGYAGLGLEEAVGEHFIGRLEGKAVYWKSDTFNTDGPSLNISLLFGYQF